MTVYMVLTVHERAIALMKITMEHATLIMEHAFANLDGLEIHALSKKQIRNIQVLLSLLINVIKSDGNYQKKQIYWWA